MTHSIYRESDLQFFPGVIFHETRHYNHPAPCLTHSVCMKPNFQGLPWLSLMGLMKMNSYCDFCWLMMWNLLWLYFFVIGR